MNLTGIEFEHVLHKTTIQMMHTRERMIKGEGVG